MFLGYANNHSGNCYRMYNPFTKKIVETWDIIWLNRMYYIRVDANITGLEPIVVLRYLQQSLEKLTKKIHMAMEQIILNWIKIAKQDYLNR